MNNLVPVASQISPAHVVYKEDDNVGCRSTLKRKAAEKEAANGEADDVHETIKELRRVFLR